MSQTILDYYSEPGRMTDLAGGVPEQALPREIERVAGLVQGVLIHREWIAAYGAQLGPERIAEHHIRSAAARVKRIAALAPDALDKARPPEKRSVGTCRDFSVLSTALLRARGIPARARCGFGAYFMPDKFIDHWVVEYWRGDRWALADAQIDSLQQKALKTDFDLFDIPRDKFVVAHDAWRLARTGKKDPEAFGIFGMHGLWFILGNLIRDFAALNKMEMLPWDVWGPMAENDDAITADTRALGDRLAALTAEPDANFRELRAPYETGESGLRVPAAVFNVLENRTDPIDL